MACLASVSRGHGGWTGRQAGENTAPFSLGFGVLRAGRRKESLVSVIGPQQAVPDLAPRARAAVTRPALERPAPTNGAELQARAQAASLLVGLRSAPKAPVASQPPNDGFDLTDRSGAGGRGLAGALGRLLQGAKDSTAAVQVAVGGGASSDAASAPTAPSAAPAAPAESARPTIREQPTIPVEHGDLAYGTVEGSKLFAKGASDKHAIDASDIRQGVANDCWLLSSLASIAVGRPELIEGNIRDLGDGTYEVTLFESVSDGLFGDAKTFEKVRVVVDAELPTYQGFDMRAYAEAVREEDGTPELWAAVYEKAVAQHLGGYGAFSNRSGVDGFQLVSGAIATQHIASELEFSQVDAWFQKGDGLAVVSMPADLAPEFEAYRDGTLMAEHVYYVSDVDAATQTVEIRNPFGWDHPPIRMPWDTFKHTLGWIDHGQLPH